MREADDHAACVDRWLATLPADAPPAALLQVFEAATRALWHEAGRTLGEMMLQAIVQRVLYVGSERFPLLGTLTLNPTGVSFALLNDQSQGLTPGEVRTAFRFLFIELLTILGSLTAEILTSGLHAALALVTWPPPGGSARDPNGKAPPQ